jgi:hypothetical protein
VDECKPLAWGRAARRITKVTGLYKHFRQVNGVITEGGGRGPLSLSYFVGLAKESLPIKTDMIIMKARLLT